MINTTFVSIYVRQMEMLTDTGVQTLLQNCFEDLQAYHHTAERVVGESMRIRIVSVFLLADLIKDSHTGECSHDSDCQYQTF